MSKEELEDKGYKTYENNEIRVYWNSNICKHAGECVKGNNEVFNPQRRPWIDLEKASANEIATIIDRCPSKALQYELKDDVIVIYEKESNRSAAYINNNLVGVCEYSIKDNNWIINHTEVDSKYEGQGIARRLVECIIKEAKRNKIKIIPLCSYAEKIIKEEYQDVL